MQADKQVDNQANHTPNGPRRLLIVQVAGLGLKTAREAPELLESLGGLECNPLEPPFPAVTSTAQATFRTASDPQAHGIVANGWFDRVWHRTTFWEQSADLVACASGMPSVPEAGAWPCSSGSRASASLLTRCSRRPDPQARRRHD